MSNSQKSASSLKPSLTLMMSLPLSVGERCSEVLHGVTRNEAPLGTASFDIYNMKKKKKMTVLYCFWNLFLELTCASLFHVIFRSVGV